MFNCGASYQAILNYQPIGKNEPAKNISFFVEPVKDLRPDTSSIGAYKNEQCLKEQDVHPSSDVSMWLSESLQKELQLAGYGISLSSRELRIETSLLEANCDFYGEFHARIKLGIRVLSHDIVLVDKNYVGETTVGAFVTDREYGRVLGIALQETMKKIMKDIKQVAR